MCPWLELPNAKCSVLDLSGDQEYTTRTKDQPVQDCDVWEKCMCECMRRRMYVHGSRKNWPVLVLLSHLWEGGGGRVTVRR